MICGLGGKVDTRFCTLIFDSDELRRTSSGRDCAYVCWRGGACDATVQVQGQLFGAADCGSVSPPPVARSWHFPSLFCLFPADLLFSAPIFPAIAKPDGTSFSVYQQNTLGLNITTELYSMRKSLFHKAVPFHPLHPCGVISTPIGSPDIVNSNLSSLTEVTRSFSYSLLKTLFSWCSPSLRNYLFA